MTLLVAPAMAQGPIAPPSGVVGWWPLDNSGTDLGSLGLDGTIMGAGGFYEPAHVLEGFRSATPDGHISVPDDNALDKVSNFTVECWVRAESIGFEHSYLVNKGTNDHRTTPWTFGLVNNLGSFPTTSGSSVTGIPAPGHPFVTLSDGNMEQVIIGNTALPLTQFAHVAFVVQWMGSMHQCRIYLNGTQIGLSWLSRIPFVGSDPLQIGGVAGGNFNTLDGLIDEVTYYDRALTGAELLAITNAGVDGKIKPNFDTTPPTLTIDSPTSGQILSSRSVALQTTIVDDSTTTVDSIPTGFSASLPAGGGTASGTLALGGADGNQLITLQATDSAGNSAATSVDVIIDTTPPTITVLGPASGTVFGSSPVQVAVEVSDMTAPTLTIGGSGQTLPAGTTSVTVDVPLIEGPNAILITAVDEAGNQASAFLDLTLDSTVPVVEILSPPDGALFGAGQDLVAVTVRVDDLTPTTVSSTPAGVSGSLPIGGGILSGTAQLAEGLNQITVTASDSAGSTSSDNITVNLDSTAPSINLSSPTPGELVRGTIEVMADAQDLAPGSGVATIELFAGNTLLASGAGGNLLFDLDTTGLADGAHSLTIIAADGARNQALATVSITVDNTAPSIQILAPLNGDVVTESLELSALVTDQLSGVTSAVQLVGGLPPATLDGSAQPASPMPSLQIDSVEDTTRWPNGALICEVQATDLAGNTATAQVEVDVQNELVQISAPKLRPRDGRKVRGKTKIVLRAQCDYDLEIQVDGDGIAKGFGSKLKTRYDTTVRLDGPMEIRGIVRDGAITAETIHHVTVDNMRVTRTFPWFLNLSPRRNKCWRWDRIDFWVKLESRCDNPLPLEDGMKIELRVRGGTSLPAVQVETSRSGHRAWMRFDRGDLVAAIRAALATGQYSDKAKRVELELFIDGNEIDDFKVKVRRGRWGG